MKIRPSNNRIDPILLSRSEASNPEPNVINFERHLLVPHQIEAAPQLAAELANPSENEGIMAENDELLFLQEEAQAVMVRDMINASWQILKNISGILSSIYH